MHKKINSYFLIFIILFSMFPVRADAPIKYYEIDSDIELRGAIFVNVDPEGFYAFLNDGIIQIDSDNHYNDVIIKFKGIALNNRLKKYNGFNVGYTHISHNGITTNELKSLEINYQGFAYLNTDFSTVIINGMTGTTTTTLTELSGNQSISVPNGSSYDLNITNNQPSVWESTDGRNYTNKSIITINGSMVTTESQIPLQLFTNLEGVNGTGDIGISYTNLTAIPREVEYVWNNDNVSLFLPYDTISSVDSQFVVLWGSDNNTELAAGSTYGSQAVWNSNYKAVWHMNNDPSGSAPQLKDSTSNNNDCTSSGSMTSADLIDGDYGKGINFDGTNDYFNRGSQITISTASHNVLTNVETGSDISTLQNLISTGTHDILITEYYSIYNSKLSYYDQGVASAWVYSNTALQASTGYITNFDYRNDNVVRFYLNGAADGTSGTTSTYDNFNFRYIGVFSDAASRYFKGKMYELRLSVGSRSDNYISTIYNNLNNPTASDINPFYKSIGTMETKSGTLNITASVTGDYNEQSYNTSQSREFTLIPTGTTNNILINTTSTNYNVTVTTYWTENTTLQSETTTAGYAKQYINYTPSFNVTSADLNTTFTFNFSEQDYIGTASSTLNDVSKTTIRNGQDVNASVGSLTESIPYWWNVTVPYNNIFTLSEQSDMTAFLSVSKQFNDSTYNDLDNNPILSRLWNFGDDNNINTSNPTHIYTSLGVFNANYTVTENATTDSQTIIKEFNVTVEILPVQNLSSVLEQTYINFNWNDYLSADYWNVSELKKSIPYLNISIDLDGIKDSTYSCCAQGIIMYSPNPQSNTNYELILLFRNSTHLIGYAEGWDDDNLNNDDYFLIGIDGENNNLTNNDRKFILNEGGSTEAKRWDESTRSWLPTSTNSIGAVNGGGVAGQISYEMIVPISEITGFTDNATIKFYMERECSYLNPTVETFYPLNLINSTDATIWKSVILTDGEVYNYIGNTSTSQFNSTGLDIFSWNKHQFITINDTTESNPVYSIDITADIQHFTVSGYIKDTLGNIVSGATVWATNGHVMEATQSDINGYYEGVNFHTGNYTIYGNKSGYAENFTNVYVNGNLTNINVTLPVYTITDWEIYQKLLLLESQNDEILLNMSINNTIVNDKIDTILIFILLNMAVIVGIIIGKRGKDNDK